MCLMFIFFAFRLVKHWGFQRNGLIIPFIRLVSFSFFLSTAHFNGIYAILKLYKWNITGGLELLDGPEPENILVGPRVGIEYALPEHVSALWRFAIGGTPWISAPKNTLRPP